MFNKPLEITVKRADGDEIKLTLANDTPLGSLIESYETINKFLGYSNNSITDYFKDNESA